MYYVKLVSPDGGVWQAVKDAENSQKIRKDVKASLGFDPGPRLSIEKLPSKHSFLLKNYFYTRVSKDEFLRKLIRPS